MNSLAHYRGAVTSSEHRSLLGAKQPMTVEQHDVIDFVAHDPDEDVVLLVMVEAREWGDAGELLPNLQEKFNTYFSYATSGRLAADYPQMIGKPVRIELRAASAPGDRELEFFRIVTAHHLEPAGIFFVWKVIGESAPSTR